MKKIEVGDLVTIQVRPTCVLSDGRLVSGQGFCFYPNTTGVTILAVETPPKPVTVGCKVRYKNDKSVFDVLAVVTEVNRLVLRSSSHYIFLSTGGIPEYTVVDE